MQNSPPIPLHRRRALPSRAALALAGEGFAITDLAHAAGVSQSYAGQILSGHRRMTDAVSTALADLVGETAYARIVALVPADTSASTLAA